MRLSLRRNRKPKWYEGAEWRLNTDNDGGFIFLPHGKEQKVYYYDNLLSFDIVQAALTELNQPSRWQKFNRKFHKTEPVRLGAVAFDLAIADYRHKREVEDAPQTRSRGHVIKNTRPVEFNPTRTRRGGRLVKVMPRQLQKMKEAQEKPVEDE